MDWLTQQLTHHKIPVGQWGKEFFGFLTSYFDWFFDGLEFSYRLIKRLTGGN